MASENSSSINRQPTAEQNNSVRELYENMRKMYYNVDLQREYCDRKELDERRFRKANNHLQEVIAIIGALYKHTYSNELESFTTRYMELSDKKKEELKVLLQDLSKFSVDFVNVQVQYV